MRRMKIFLVAFVCALSLSMGIGSLAYGSDLTRWANFFSYSQSKITEYHFALFDAVPHGKVPHLDTATVYVFVQSGKASEYCDSSTIASANAYLGGHITIVAVSSASQAHVQISYLNDSSSRTGYVRPPNSSDTNTDGTLKRNGTASIILKDDYFQSSADQRARTLAHEIGHVVGLDDVYDHSSGNLWPGNDPSTSKEFMGMGKFSLNALGVGDLNGLNIIRHNPWYREQGLLFDTWKYWGFLLRQWSPSL